MSQRHIKKILVVGSMMGQTAQRVQAFRECGFDVITISETPEGFAPGITYHPSFMDRVRHRLGRPKDKQYINQKIRKLICNAKFDVLWVEKALTLKPSTLHIVKNYSPNILCVWYSGDDMFARHNQSLYFRQSLPLYDVVITTKSYNANPNELPALGARRVWFVNKTYDPHQHQPVTVTDEDKKCLGADVGFIGTFEKDRADKMLFLGEQGIKVRVWGNGWGAYKNRHANLMIENKPIYDNDYQKAICATKINLCFLRKLNRDLQTDRTVEIPACGGFMLAERTKEHESLFKDNQEAIFFDNHNQQELLDKVRYFLAHDDERKHIAESGRKRCLASDYSHHHMLREIVSRLESL